MVKKLVDNGVDINARDLNGRTALMVSAIRGSDDIIQYLIKNGADYKLVDKDGMNVLDYYYKRVYLNDDDFKHNKYASIAEQLFQKFTYISESHKKYNNLLKNSIKNSDEEKVVIEAIKRHADIDVKDENMCTPLLNAAQNNLGSSIFRDLLVSGANPNAACLGGKTALMFLAANSNVIEVYDQLKKVSLLYEYKVDPNIIDDDGNNALMYAVDFNANSGVIKGLLDIGVNPNTVNKKGETIIGNAVKKGIGTRALEMLIEGGADLSVNEEGMPLIWYVLENDVRDDIVITLANGGIDLSVTNKNNDSPLWYAMYNEVSLPIMLALIENEKEIDNINSNEDTYLLYAIKNDFPASVIKALLSAGANPYIVDKNGNNAIDIIKKSQYFEETMKRKTKEYVLDDWEF
jgi:ankyrin repeat protein